MKKLGLIGGMSWESTVSYYQMINRAVNEKLGGFHSAKILLSSVDFAEIERLQRAQAWPEMATLLHAEAKALTTAGADAIVICTNTMHKVADEVASNLSIPLLHIVDATGEVLVNDSVKKVGLLGTKFTMEQTFYTERLRTNFGIDVVVPPPHERDIIHNVIYAQLCKGVICTESRKAYINIIDGLASEGAEGVILGCTEIALLVQQNHTAIRLYDTTAIHAEAAVDFAVDV
ncbi:MULTISPECIES: aspartate/glutamate racemase family protein [unclassified Alteromonas]|uniref:aspartate/glutamate racemase family protein n=1 Tax=unclassified Alteromonas TaxID=2614992 RepID=UPI000509FB31|nr:MULTISPECIES: aspartate/glutamate racemase family protein [unclassified Alteromonas]